MPPPLPGQSLPLAKCSSIALRGFEQQATCQFAVPFGQVLASILHGTIGRPGWNEVDDVSSLSEPYGSDGAMAERSRIGVEISQSGPARRLRPAIRTARRGAGADLAHLPHLYPPGLR